ncbi:hypothetical protein EC957_007776 [Mortierella hygrophila]|uniref:Uncharacterized protein n=1 Tax=Mortierella hygrophila TaxID=979708 RepID=A0A9P6K5W2_9FUNG|nr:hypothetical protein EC957_007776 [Mortierella hygrophila]
MSKANNNDDQDLQYPPTSQQTSHSTTPSLHNQPLLEEAPPSYDAVIAKDIPQLHDNYDHLRGPPGQRGRDIKDRIPSESIARYQSQGGSNSGGVGSSSGGGAGSSSISTSAAAAGGAYGASSPYEPHYGATRVIAHSPTSAQAPPLGLTGQIALGQDSDEDFAQNTDRRGSHSSLDSDDPYERSCWTIVGDQKAWIALFYMIVVLLPWTIFCFVWVLVFGLVAMILMIIPPIGYLFTVFAVFSIRALARVDIVLSALLVSDTVATKYPYFTSQVFIGPEPGPAWQNPRFFGYTMPLPTFIQQRLESRHAARNRRPKNLWHRGANHMKTILDGHTTKGFFYFVVWKMMFAIPIFCVTVVLFVLNVPFMVCFLPSLLNISKAFANWQYRWAVTWLSGKPAPIVL